MPSYCRGYYRVKNFRGETRVEYWYSEKSYDNGDPPDGWSDGLSSAIAVAIREINLSKRGKCLTENVNADCIEENQENDGTPTGDQSDSIDDSDCTVKNFLKDRAEFDGSEISHLLFFAHGELCRMDQMANPGSQERRVRAIIGIERYVEALGLHDAYNKLQKNRHSWMPCTEGRT